MIGDSGRSWESDYYSNPRIVEHHLKRASAFYELERLLHGFAPEHGRLLDIGCGVGMFLGIAQDAGWEVVGIEPSATAVELARQRVRGRILQGDSLGSEERGSFDAVTCFDVLRTVPQPMATLKRACEALRPGGVVMIRETNERWPRPSKMRGRRQSLAHQYAQQWPPRTMRLSLERAGFVHPRILPSPFFLDGCESRARLHFKRILFLLSRTVYTVSRRILAPNMLAVARRPCSVDLPE